MSSKSKKVMLKRQIYLPKNIIKHQHDYCVECILEIQNKNIHASGLGYNSIEYHNILKCAYCDSFIPKSNDGNFNGTIFDIKDINKSLPLIKAITYEKNPVYSFSKLVCDKNEINLININLTNFKKII